VVNVLDDILTMLDERRGIDFRDYRQETVARAVMQRVQVLRAPSIEAYRDRLRDDEGELGTLLESVLVPVTEFFRDRQVFEDLATNVLPRFVWSRPPKWTLRTWCIGCATGEEAWSMAMLLEEGRDVFGFSEYEIVASDLHEPSLAYARQGLYPPSTLYGTPDRLLHRFFTRTPTGFSVGPSLRSRVEFVRHDVLGHTMAPSTAVIATFDVILLRNVLIYFDRRLQTKVLERVSSMLDVDGVLVLGAVETLPNELSEVFETFPDTNPKERIFRKRRVAG
jgi:two-component system CheB/CheR fusion protein